MSAISPERHKLRRNRMPAFGVDRILAEAVFGPFTVRMPKWEKGPICPAARPIVITTLPLIRFLPKVIVEATDGPVLVGSVTAVERPRRCLGAGAFPTESARFYSPSIIMAAIGCHPIAVFDKRRLEQMRPRRRLPPWNQLRGSDLLCETGSPSPSSPRSCGPVF